jgi:hypothetical protein
MPWRLVFRSRPQSGTGAHPQPGREARP